MGEQSEYWAVCGGLHRGTIRVGQTQSLVEESEEKRRFEKQRKCMVFGVL